MASMMVAAGFVLAVLQTASPSPSWLAVEPAPGADHCPVAAEIVSDVNARLGRAPFVAGDGVRTKVYIHPRGRGLRARIEMLDRDGSAGGTRELTVATKDCGKLASMVVLSLVFALSDETSGETAGPSEPPSPARPELSRVDSNPLVQIADGPRPTPPLPRAAGFTTTSRTLFAGLVGSAGLLPGPSVGVSFGAGFSLGRLGLETWLQGDWAYPARHAGVDISAWRVTGGGGPCVEGSVFSACAAIRGGVMVARASDLGRGRTATIPAVEAGPRGRLRLTRASSWTLELVGEIAVPIVRSRLLIDRQEAWRAWPITAALSVGARWGGE